VSHTVTISAYTNLANGLQVELQIPSGSLVSGDTVRIMEPMLCAAGQVSTFEVEPVPETESRCERFYEKSFAAGTAPAQNVGTNTAESTFRAVATGAAINGSPQIRFRIRKRATPNVTIYNPAAANAQVRDETAGADCASSAIGRQSVNGFDVGCTGAAGTAVGNVLGIHWIASSRLF
jgi:hypothetical protein